MPYTPVHKENTRRRIVEAAAAAFRREGIAEAGVASIMRAAGLTHGGFYSHFESKDDLVAAAISEAQQAAPARWKRLAEDPNGPGGLEAIARWYLSPDHRDCPESGCITSCVAADLPRLPETARAEFTRNLREFLEYIATLLPEGQPRKIEAAMAIYAGMLGALQLARATDDAMFSDALLEAGIGAALRLASG